MLDLVIRNGQVVTPQGVGAWDVGVRGERIAAVTEPGTLPLEGARVIDAAGRVVVPGGVDPHTHLAHPIMSHPEEPAITMRPEGEIPSVLEQRAARWKGNSHVDYAFHITLAGALPLSVFEQIPEAIRA